jgi:hypothetical protein
MSSNKGMKDLDINRMNEEDINSDENTENTIDDFEPTDAELKEMMKELHISEEAETKDKILEDWREVMCVACLKPVDLMKAVFIDEAPYHKYCAEEELRYEN